MPADALRRTYARLGASDKVVHMRRIITSLFELTHHCYGYRRMRAALARQQVFISEKVVRPLINEESWLFPLRRRRCGSYPGEVGPAPKNVIDPRLPDLISDDRSIRWIDSSLLVPRGVAAS